VFVLAAVTMAVYAATDTGFAFLMNNLVKTLTPGELTPTQQQIGNWLPAAILLLFVARGGAAFVSTYSLGWIGRRVIKKLRRLVFNKFLDLPTAFFDRTSAGELLSKLTYNIEQVAESTSNVVTIMVRDTLTIAGLGTYMVYLSPPLSAFLFIVAPLISLLIRFLSRIFRRHSARIQDSMGDVTRITEEALQGHRIVKIFGGKEYENARFDAVNEKNRRLNMRLIASRAAGDAVTGLVIAIGVAGVVFFSTLESVRPDDLGDFVGFITAMVFLMRPLRQLTNMNVALQRGIAAGASVFRLLDAEEERDTGKFVPSRVEGEVKFLDVCFSYDEKGSVLRHIDLAVPPGQTLAIVGRSGSGKSTLVSLLARFYEPDSGQILIDRRPLADYPLAALREQISLVSQEVVLFNDTIAENIAYGALSASSRSDIEASAQAAHVDEFTSHMPHGLDTEVGERGVLLSGGQRQRIAIARALLKNAPILILDEATSALDTESERHIQDALAQLMLNRTTFVIAHRLSTVERADRIIVMANGRVVESGTHTELLASGGQYANLYRLQFRDEAG
jgi:subfamily B ATP-binding cassette protein MsbA